MHHTRLISLAVVAALVAVTGACATDEEPRQAADTTQPPGAATATTVAAPGGDGELYVISFSSGSYADGTLTLAPDAEVVGFADRPARSATNMPVEPFVQAWADNFGDDPPNAALTVASEVSVLELGAPTLAGGNLTFPVTVESPSPPPATFGTGSLYIDTAAADPAFDAVMFQYTLPPGGQFSLTWSNATPTVPQTTVGQAAFVVAPVQTDQPTGEVISLYYQFVIGTDPSTGAAGAGQIPMTIVWPGDTDIEGTAQVSEGASVQVKRFDAADWVILTDGESFSLPPS